MPVFSVWMVRRLAVVIMRGVPASRAFCAFTFYPSHLRKTVCNSDTRLFCIKMPGASLPPKAGTLTRVPSAAARGRGTLFDLFRAFLFTIVYLYIH